MEDWSRYELIITLSRSGWEYRRFECKHEDKAALSYKIGDAKVWHGC